MSANQEAMRLTIRAADRAKVDAVVAAKNNYQSAIAASGAQAGFRPGFPAGFATYDAAVKAADRQAAADLFAAESARQMAIFVAKDLLRSQGEIPF